MNMDFYASLRVQIKRWRKSLSIRDFSVYMGVHIEIRDFSADIGVHTDIRDFSSDIGGPMSILISGSLHWFINLFYISSA